MGRQTADCNATHDVNNLFRHVVTRAFVCIVPYFALINGTNVRVQASPQLMYISAFPLTAHGDSHTCSASFTTSYDQILTVGATCVSNGVGRHPAKYRVLFPPAK